jgi:hypothetical protein
MKKILFPIYLVLFFLLFFTLQSFFPGTKTVGNEQELLSKANLFNLKFPQEKIYLHLDRNSYWANDDIWFKAYLKNSPIPESNLYVELVSSKGAIVYKNLCWAQNGLAYGDIHLADTLSSGVYQIRAYTDWLRNFDDAWFFRKNLVIWNLRDKQANVETNDLKAKEIDLQFFPEGGTFISGLKNRVAFKAIDKNGKGIDLEGEITDDRGTKITDIKSEFRGMGSFVFMPEENRNYTAKVQVAGKITLQVNLPTPQKEGVAFAVDPADTSNIQIAVSVKSRISGNNQASDYLLVGQAGGGICYRNKVGTTGKLLIDRNSLPSGIVKFTLFDSEMIPRCERLVFINHHDNINVEIKPDKTDYITREKVQLDLKAISGAGIPYNANLSVSVYNPENQLETEKYPDNILTHFLLNSELRGTIEEPAWYFKDDSLSTLLALDNLMLTHGYRQFEWKEIREDKYPEIVYQPVGCIQLGGTVKSTIRNKPLAKAKVSMMTVKSLLGTYQQTTDSLGHFLFSDLFFNDTVYVALQAVNEKGNRNTEIEIDERSGTSPKTGYLPFIYKYEKENEVLTSTFLSELSPEIINRKWRLSDTILLGDINVVTKKKESNDELVRMYADPDYVVKVTKEDALYTNVVEMMDSKPYLRMFTEAQFYLNGAPVDRDFLESLPVNGFDKVEVVKFSPIIKGGGPGVFFYLKRGAPQYVPADVFGMKSYAIIGYSVIREFYSPEYENRDIPIERKDFRSTLYWNPIVRTDSTGVARVSFYNSDEAGTMQVVVEGVTADGKLCRGVCRYKVSY